MSNIKILAMVSALAILAGCMKPAPEMTQEQAAEHAQLRANAIAAECALYVGTGITPEGCS